MTKWVYNGSTLQYAAMAIENPEVDTHTENKQKKDLNVNFLCIAFVQKIAITGGEDGIVTHFYILDLSFIFFDSSTSGVRTKY